MELKRELARDLFLSTSLTQKVIAERVGVSEKTMGGWITKYGWDSVKELNKVTKSELYNQALKQLKVRNQQMEELDLKDFKNLKILSDSIAVLLKQIELLMDTPIHLYIEVVNQLIDFIAKERPEALKEVTLHCSTFIEAVNARQK